LKLNERAARNPESGASIPNSHVFEPVERLMAALGGTP
jgi:hypothetical protein